MSTEILFHFFITQILISGILWLAFGLRLSRWSDGNTSSILLNIPVILLLLSWLGAISTVGWQSVVGLGVPFVLVGIYFFGKPVVTKPKGFVPTILLSAVVCATLYLIRFFCLSDSETSGWLCVHNDDYSYIQQTNLIRLTGKESHFYELIRNWLGLPFQYKPYHYAEFYLIILFQKVFGFSTYIWFQFFIKTILGVFGLLSIVLFTQSESKEKHPITAAFFFFAVLFFTLRFVLADDFFHQFWPQVAYWKSVIFQNQYYAHPLAYFRGYKISLAFIYVLPVIYLVRKQHFFAAIVFGLAASIVSTALLPISVILVGIGWFANRFSFRLTSLLVILFVILAYGFKFFAARQPVAPFQFLNLEIQSLVNLIFENHYWHLVILTTVLLLSGIRGKKAVFLLILCLFPLIYLLHGPLFKVFVLIFFFGLGFYFYKNKNLKSNIFRDEFFLAILVLFGFLPFISPIANAMQVFTNLTFLFFLYLCSRMWTEYGNVKNQNPVILFSLIFLVLVSLPALRYDIQVPLHREDVAGEVLDRINKAASPVRILSIAKYSHLPHMDPDQLGDGLLNASDNQIIMIGGFESFSKSDRKLISDGGFGPMLERIPYQQLMTERGPGIVLPEFISRYQISMLLVQLNDELRPYHQIMNELGWVQSVEKNKGYAIYYPK